jgi:hypothetical protein
MSVTLDIYLGYLSQRICRIFLISRSTDKIISFLFATIDVIFGEWVRKTVQRTVKIMKSKVNRIIYVCQELSREREGMRNQGR